MKQPIFKNFLNVMFPLEDTQRL